MATKTIRGVLEDYDGTTALYALVFAESAATPLNGTGDNVTFSSYNSFTFDWTEAISGGVYDVQLYKVSDNTVVSARGKVYVPADIAGTFYIDSVAELNRQAFTNQVFPVVLRDSTDTNSIRFYWPLASASISGTKVIDNGSSAAVSGAVTYVGASGAFYEYNLAYSSSDRPTGAGTVRYTMTDGTNTRQFTLQLLSGNTASVYVTPITGQVIEEAANTTLKYKLNESKSYSVQCVDADGDAVTLTGMTLTISFERLNSTTDKTYVDSADITINGSTYTFTNPAAVTNEVGQLKWDLWNGSVWLQGGIATVDAAAKKDA